MNRTPGVALHTDHSLASRIAGAVPTRPRNLLLLARGVDATKRIAAMAKVCTRRRNARRHPG